MRKRVTGGREREPESERGEQIREKEREGRKRA